MWDEHVARTQYSLKTIDFIVGPQGAAAAAVHPLSKEAIAGIGPTIEGLVEDLWQPFRARMQPIILCDARDATMGRAADNL
ncbi:hypothetical protein QTP86_013351 [Hemibagrus guttatus]|nr:hypothetical protein QTP86_013351 [Hemibagrus guttatus]